MKGIGIVGADVQMDGVRFIVDHVPHLANIDFDHGKTIEVHKAQQPCCTTTFMKSIQCGQTNLMASRVRLNNYYRDSMLSDINKKRTPDYVKESIRRLKW